MAEAGRGAAVDGVTRTMALALGVAAVLLSIVALPLFLVQYGVAHPVWTWAVAVGMFVPPLVAAMLSPWVPPRVLRGLAASAAIAQLLGLALLVPALPGGSLGGHYGTPWPLAATATGTTAAAVAWRAGPAFGYLGATIVLLGLDRYLALPSPNVELAVQDALYTLMFNVVFVALALTTRRAGVRLDAAADAAAAETRIAAASAARRRERTRVEALLHDNVLVALLASSRGSERAAAQARSALEELDAVPDDEVPLDDTTWVWRLQALTTDLAPGARFSHEQRPSDDDEIPAEAGRALLEATAEAVRNSIQHAGTASRAVHARITEEVVEVTVLDDGAGFDPAQLPPGRLGLTVSILERMRTVPGGAAAVVSRPGVGTRVSLTWRRAA